VVLGGRRHASTRTGSFLRLILKLVNLPICPLLVMRIWSIAPALSVR
jgi:hypothetical protein